jgi:spore maturation protein CgeB
MKIVIFGLTISSSWGNGHATLWRGLCRALAQRGHKIVFFERDVPYYSGHRDLVEPGYFQLILYRDWDDVMLDAKIESADAEVAIVTSYCPDGIAASEVVLDSSAKRKIFYDLDTPVTLERLRKGEQLGYIGPRGLKDFDLVLSYTGGAALDLLKVQLGAKRTAPLYGSVDPGKHFPVEAVSQYRCDFSYLGTYAADRQAALQSFFISPARLLQQKKFFIGGALYPQEFPWAENIFFARHLPPAEHPAFFCSSKLTLNITRRAMAEMGYCPSGRLFEAAACGTPIVSDWWEGMGEFFAPESEVIIVRTTEDITNALEMSDVELSRIANAARARVMEEHTAAVRAEELEQLIETTVSLSQQTQTTGA